MDEDGSVADDRLDQLQREMADLLERMERLEQTRGPGGKPSLESAAPRLALNTEPARSEAAAPGFLTYSGSVSFGGTPFKLHSHQPVAAAFSAEPDRLARIFAALGSPHRVVMLRALCGGPKTGQQLEDAAGISSTGQLYHHLRELQAAGLVVQPARSVYALRPPTVIAVCVGLMLASDLTAAASPAAEPDPDQGVPGSASAGNPLEA